MTGTTIVLLTNICLMNEQFFFLSKQYVFIDRIKVFIK
jgi:hypothetical protein